MEEGIQRWLLQQQLLYCANNPNSVGWKYYEEGIPHLVMDGNVWKLASQVAADSANKDDLEAAPMFSKMKQLRDDETGRRAIEAVIYRDYSTMKKLTARIMDVENDLIAYEQSRDPFRRFWNPIDLVLNLAQIVVAIVILIHLKREEDQSLLGWMIVYACGCILHLPIICYRLCWVIISMDHSSFYRYEKRVEELLAIWSAVLFWHFVGHSSYLNDTTQHIWLSWAFFAFIIVRYGIANINWIMVCLPPILMEWVSNYVDYLISLSHRAQTLINVAEFAYGIIILFYWCRKPATDRNG